MKEKKFIIKNKLGFHTRVAAILVEHISRFESEVTISKDDYKVDGKSIMGIMTLAAGEGSEVTVISHGKDEEAVLEKINELIEGKFGED